MLIEGWIINTSACLYTSLINKRVDDLPWSNATIIRSPRSAGTELCSHASQTDRAHYQPPRREDYLLYDTQFLKFGPHPSVLRKVVTLTTWAELRKESYNCFQPPGSRHNLL
jgi:hypothetical protein